MLDKLDHRKPTVIAGDFNVHFELQTKEALQLTDLFSTYGLVGTVSDLTRGKACLDNIFTNFDLNFCSAEVVDPGMSDHLAIHFRSKNHNLTTAAHRRVVLDP